MGFTVWLAVMPAGAVNGPRIACLQPECRFGTAADSQALEHTFSIINDGEAPLQIGNIRGCCGATIAMPDRTIPPGSNSALKVSLSLRGRRGEMRKSIYVGSNDPRQPYYQLRFLGTVTAPVYVEPASVDFGMLDQQAATSAFVRVVSASNLSLRVTNAVSGTALFSTYVDVEVGRGAWRIGIQTVPPLPMGVTRGMVTVLTDNRQYAKVEIPVTASVASDLVTVPSEIALAPGGEKPTPATCHVAIRSRTGKPFKILDTQAPERDIKVDCEALTSGGYRITLSNVLPFEDLDGRDLVITTDHETAKRITIPFHVASPDGKRKERP